MIRSLEIGKRALLASQRGFDVTSNNIANVNTPGYTRQALMLRPGESIPVGGMYLGMGVLSAGIRQFRDYLIDRDQRTYTSTQSYYQQESTIIQRIETALGEPGDQTLQVAMQQFFDAASQLAANPSRIANRQLFIARASDLANTFNRTSAAIDSLRNSTYERISNNVQRVNQLLSTLASLNQQINATLDASGQPAASLVDQQTHALQELSQYLDINITREPTGAINVTSSGIMLVSLGTALTLREEKHLDAGTGETTVGYRIEKPDGTTVATFEPKNGELASLTKHYNITLNPLTTSPQFSVARELDRLAVALAGRVNALTSIGYGLNDTGPTPSGRALFTSSGGGPLSARTITVNPTVASDPASLPTSSTPGTPGNNDLIASIASLATDGTFLDSMTPEGFYGSVITQLAQYGASANDRLSAAKTVLQQITSERESLAGVNLDEEATNLITYQRAFEAAARVISVSSDMLSTLVNLGR